MDRSTRDQLFALVSALAPGRRVTGNALRVDVARGVVGKPTAELTAVLVDPAALARAFDAYAGFACLVFRVSSEGYVRRRWSREERRGAVIDLNNLVWSVGSESVRPVLCRLRSLGLGALVGVGDANLPYVWHEATQEALALGLDELHVAPSGTPADTLILALAEDRDLLVVSNDRFRDWRGGRRWRRRHLWRLRLPVHPTTVPPYPHLEKAGSEPWFDFGEAGCELLDAPPDDAAVCAPENIGLS